MAVNLGVFDKFLEGQEVTAGMLMAKGIIRNTKDTVKVLGGGILKKNLFSRGLFSRIRPRPKLLKPVELLQPSLAD